MSEYSLPPPGTPLRPAVPEAVADDHALSVLDFPAVLEALAAHCQSSLGVECALALRPQASATFVAAALAETDAARALVDRRQTPSCEGLHDVRALIGRAARGGVLAPPEIVRVGATAGTLGDIRAFFATHGSDNACLTDWSGRIADFSVVRAEVERCLTADGEVSDRASSALARARAEARHAESRLRAKLEELLRQSSVQGLLQEPIITQRRDRFVLPVRSDSRSQFPGVVHDQSSSGQTVFIEPLAVVGLGNDLRQAQAEVEREVERVLLRLSALCGERRAEWLDSLEAAAHLDMVLARARLSQAWGARAPALLPLPALVLKEARHPLLQRPVPIDLTLGLSYDALVVTGPNTGGKTVSLKTAGLFACMAQAGLHLPVAEGSQLGPFPRILLDVGDEQGVVQNLSTFSSHVRRIVAALGALEPGALVLLDELGAGTDPQEGSALAMAVLEHLLDGGARVMVTSHFSELKAFAERHPRASNASVSFDPATLAPTYHLCVGIPGPSQALAIALQLGVPSAIVDRAREYVHPVGRAVESLVTAMAEERAQLHQALQTATQENEQLRVLRAALAAEEAQQQKDRERLLADARQEAERVLAEAQRMAVEVVRELRALAEEREKADALARAEAVRAATAQARARVARAPERARVRTDDPLRKGQHVHVQSVGLDGVVLVEPEGDDVQVQAGNLRLTVPRSDLLVRDGPVVNAPAARSPAGQWSGRDWAVGMQFRCDLRGMRVDEALATVDKLLDDAVLAGMHAVEVIHGKGTGALRAAVAEFLRDHPQVDQFRSGLPEEGGVGVTVVSLRD